jgi:sulfate/thiosulfate transport system permease protein
MSVQGLLRTSRVGLPGFAPSATMTVLWVAPLVLLPLCALILRPWEAGLSHIVAVITEPRVLASLRLSFGAALVASLVDVPIGLLIAWVLVRYRFPLRTLWDAVVDLPFALPTAVAGIALTTLYADTGWLGAPLAAVGVQVDFALPGILVALAFCGLPFVVRSIQPVLMDLPVEIEEAAATLGATRAQTVWLTMLPALAPALVTGFGLAFARAVGEYGSVVFIAGNVPLSTEIAPLVIITRLEQYDYAGAAAVGLVMLLGAAVVLGLLNLLQRRLA